MRSGLRACYDPDAETDIDTSDDADDKTFIDAPAKVDVNTEAET